MAHTGPTAVLLEVRTNPGNLGMHIDSMGAVQAARQGSLFGTGTWHGNGIVRPAFELSIMNNEIVLDCNNRIPNTLHWIASTLRFSLEFRKACF